MATSDRIQMMRPDVDAIRARADAATAGAWRWMHTPSAHSLDYPRGTPDEEWDGQPDESLNFDELRASSDLILYGVWGNDSTAAVGVWRAEDAAFIAHARDDIPALLAYIERLEVAVQRIAADEHDRTCLQSPEGCSCHRDIARTTLGTGGG